MPARVLRAGQGAHFSPEHRSATVMGRAISPHVCTFYLPPPHQYLPSFKASTVCRPVLSTTRTRPRSCHFCWVSPPPEHTEEWGPRPLYRLFLLLIPLPRLTSGKSVHRKGQSRPRCSQSSRDRAGVRRMRLGAQSG